jgi:hypothetical protein
VQDPVPDVAEVAGAELADVTLTVGIVEEDGHPPRTT